MRAATVTVRRRLGSARCHRASNRQSSTRPRPPGRGRGRRTAVVPPPGPPRPAKVGIGLGAVWQTALHNPDFARYAEICGALGVRVTESGQLDDALAMALDHDGPSLVEVIADPELV